MINFALAGIASGLGAVCRFLITNFFKTRFNGSIATFGINITGSLLLGMFFASLSSNWLMVMGTGFCGGFTTFSTFNSEVAGEIFNEKNLVALVYLVASYTIGLLLCALGFAIGKYLF